jgi:hypothetical protein
MNGPYSKFCKANHTPNQQCQIRPPLPVAELLMFGTKNQPQQDDRDLKWDT